ncbi:hypothetical protein [Paraburkholderia sp. Ac-20347]|uniref:hypothetical protein n=1 Tax=Paraburkholderia sp. Ac-20347 TaxID=2703892 RepID=UPI00197F3996|nr:hypothetical protein [Paraburkholderia sp. Ac-20347]MBN3807671.1 hypothetical protein [Paraburkholderia sp. Ac-20347]
MVSGRLGTAGMQIFGRPFADETTPRASRQLAEAWKSIFRMCNEFFGLNCCMFETNFPVDKQTFNYCSSWNVFRWIESLPFATDKMTVFSRPERRGYRLSDRAVAA